MPSRISPGAIAMTTTTHTSDRAARPLDLAADPAVGRASSAATTPGRPRFARPRAAFPRRLREDRGAHVFRTLGGGLVAEYGPG
jgi:hypothetical protein